ncbi:MAG: GatB/YqeY domain-containing protein [Legionellaceae bacterium]|nr:GatB/YqeY domain-containing protein [Legionellaceae bacterium]
MTIKDQILADLKDAMRARDKKRLEVLRLVSAAIKQIEVDERIIVDDARMLQILDKMAKQRKESISQFQKAERHDLVEQEEFELQLISHYLPAPLSEAEIDRLIACAVEESKASAMADMGKVMALLKPQIQGRADMAMVSQRIKNKLQ